MIYLKAFLVGGVICALTQIFIDKTKLMPGRIMVGLVVIGTLLGALGWYESLIDFSIVNVNTWSKLHYFLLLLHIKFSPQT